MTKYARLTDANADGDRQVIEVIEGDPNERFHPSIAGQFISVPNDTLVGSLKNGQAWTHPEPAEPEPDPVAPRRLQVSPVEFKMLFTSGERIAIRQAREAAEPDLVIDDWFGILDDPRLEFVDLAIPQTQDGLAYLVQAGILSEARRDEIAAGVYA